MDHAKSRSLFRLLLAFAVVWSIYSAIGAFAFWKLVTYYGASKTPVPVSSLTPYAVPFFILAALTIRFRGSLVLFSCLLLIPIYSLIKMTLTLGIGVWNSGALLLLGLAVAFGLQNRTPRTQTQTTEHDGGLKGLQP